MRVFTISDIHADYKENLKWIGHLSLVDYQEDILLLGGDISHKPELLAEVFTLLKERFDQLFFVPGNHDLWLGSVGPRDSLTKFRKLLELCHSLEVVTEPRKIGRDAAWIVPLLSWYEKPESSHKSLFIPKKGEDPSLGAWVDDWAIKWPDLGGLTTARYFHEQNSRAFPPSDDAPVITFSHFLPRSELMFPTPLEREDPSFPTTDPHPSFNFSRVAGSWELDEQLRELGAKIHIYGHQHRNRELLIDGVRYLSHCLGYPKERLAGRTRGIGREPKLLCTL